MEAVVVVWSTRLVAISYVHDICPTILQRWFKVQNNRLQVVQIHAGWKDNTTPSTAFKFLIRKATDF
jgi:hypothetical protein